MCVQVFLHIYLAHLQHITTRWWNQRKPVSSNWVSGNLPSLYLGFSGSLVEKFDAVNSSIQRLPGLVCPNAPMGKESPIHYPRRDRVPLVNFLICLVIQSHVQLNRLNSKCLCVYVSECTAVFVRALARLCIFSANSLWDVSTNGCICLFMKIASRHLQVVEMTNLSIWIRDAVVFLKCIYISLWKNESCLSVTFLYIYKNPKFFYTNFFYGITNLWSPCLYVIWIFWNQNTEHLFKTPAMLHFTLFTFLSKIVVLKQILSAVNNK